MFVLPAVLVIFLSGAQPQTSPVPQTQKPVQTPAKSIVEGVVTQNNRRIPSDTIKYNIRTKPGDVLDLNVIRADMRRLYALGYFDNITVYEENGATGKIVIFEVKEKRLIRSIDYKGLKSYTRSEVLDRFRENKLGLTEEMPYDPGRVNKAEAVIKQMLAQKGHQNATVRVERQEVPPDSVRVTFNIDEGPNIKIEKIRFEGNKVFSAREIRNVMKLEKQAGPISSLLRKDSYYNLKLADDLTRIRMLYDEHGYVRVNIHEPDVVVKPATIYRTFPFIKLRFPLGIPIPFWHKTLDRYFIAIKIDENDQYRIGTVRIAGTKLFTPDRVQAVLGIQEGDIFNGTAVRKGFEDLKKLYGTLGYINYAPVPTQGFDEANKRINLEINVDEGHQYFVHRINFTGNTTTHDKVIRREIKIDEGDVFNSQLWDMSLLRLNQLGYFEQIKSEDTEIKPAPQEGSVDINLKLKEKGRSTISLSGGISGVGGSFLGLNYQSNNFLGMGETVQLALQGGTRSSNYVLGFTEPYFRDRPLTLGGQVFFSKIEYEQTAPVTSVNPSQLPSVLGVNSTLNFTEQRAGFSAYGSYPVKIWSRAGLNFTWEDSKTAAINPATQDYFSTVILQQTSGFITSGGGFATLHTHKLVPTYTFNTADSPVNPHKGQTFTATLEYAGRFLGGNVNLVRPTLDYRFFHPINKNRNTLAFRVMASYIRPKSGTAIPFYERFFLGGDFDIRGFDFRSISPVAFITRQIPITDPVTGVTTVQPLDDIVYVGGDTQGVFNFEYRIPIAGPFTLAPYLDVGGTWATQLSQLVRNVVDAEGNTVPTPPNFLAGTNTGIRSSTGVEFQVLMPIINAPFRLIFDYNPLRIDRQYNGIANGLPFQIKDPAKNVKFTVGRTF